jgi:hypothetical protein
MSINYWRIIDVTEILKQAIANASKAPTEDTFVDVLKQDIETSAVEFAPVSAAAGFEEDTRRQRDVYAEELERLDIRCADLRRAISSMDAALLDLNKTADETTPDAFSMQMQHGVKTSEVPT